MLRRSLLSFMALLTVLTVLLSACGTKPATPTPGPSTPSTPVAKKPAVGGEMTTAVPADPDTLAYFWITSAYAALVVTPVYGDGLVKYDDKKNIVPALAESLPTVSADGKTYTFKVRKGIKWHDGQPVTAKDFKLTCDIVMSPDYTGPSKTEVDHLQSCNLKDDYTIEYVAKDVFAPFLTSIPADVPMPAHLIGNIPVKDLQKADFWQHPVGAGPYKFVEWKTGQYTLLQRFADYWENNQPGAQGGTNGPWVDKYYIKVIPDDNTVNASLEAGDLTFQTSVTSSAVGRLLQSTAGKMTAYDWDRQGYGYQTFNNDRFPTNIKEVRQALSYALNRPAIISGVMDNRASIPPGFVPPVHWLYDPSVKGYNYDPKKAEELLQQAGFKKNAKGIYEKDGKPLHIRYVATKGNPTIDGIALESQKDWAAIGVETELIMVDFNTLLQKHLMPGEYEVTFSGLGFSTEPHWSFDAFHSRNITIKDGVNTGTNRARYKNPTVDALIDKGATTLNQEERKKIYQEAQKIIVDDAVMNWVYVNKYTDFGSVNLKGVINNKGVGMDFKTQWFMKDTQ